MPPTSKGIINKTQLAGNAMVRRQKAAVLLLQLGHYTSLQPFGCNLKEKQENGPHNNAVLNVMPFAGPESRRSWSQSRYSQVGVGVSSNSSTPQPWSLQHSWVPKSSCILSMGLDSMFSTSMFCTEQYSEHHDIKKIAEKLNRSAHIETPTTFFLGTSSLRWYIICWRCVATSFIQHCPFIDRSK